MKKTIIGTLSLIAMMVSVLIYTACNRKKDSIGPTYYVAPADFSVVSFDVPDNAIDFTTEKCTINVELSHQVTWTLKFTGLTSGASRNYTGATKTIDASNALWNGTHEGLYFFRAGEDVKIELTFFGSEIKKVDTINIVAARNYADYANNSLIVVGPNNGYESYANNANVNTFPGQFTFLSGGCTGTKKVTDSIFAVEGTKSYIIKAKSCDPDGYFVGGMQHRRAGFYMPSWTDPSKIYFNIFVYGTGDPNAKLNLEFHEADASSNVLKASSDPSVTGCAGAPYPVDTHCPCVDDGWVYQAGVNHTGWKLISVKYSDMPKSASPTNGGNGDGVREPNRVHRVQIGVISSPPNNVVTAIWDYPIITYGAPFDPTL